MFFGSCAKAGTRRDSAFASISTHFKGQVGLISLRGPEAFVSDASHKLFVDIRLYIVSFVHGQRIMAMQSSVIDQFQAVTAIFIRKSVSFNSHRWKTIPWRLTPKQPKDTLADIFLDIGLLLEQMDQARTYGTSIQERDKLMEKAVGVKNALQSWSSSISLDIERFDYTKIAIMPTELTRDRDMSLLYLTNLYWCASMLVVTSIGLINYIEITSKDQTSAYDGSSDLKDMKEGKGIEETTKVATDDELEMLLTSVLESAAPYAYKIAHSCQLLLGPRAGTCIYSMSVVPISLALSLLTACESARQASPERRRLACLFTSHALNSWVTEFTVATENSADKEALAKARRFRWWTKGLLLTDTGLQ